MNDLRKKAVLLMALFFIAFSVNADVVDTGKGKVNVGNPKIKYGPSATYNPNGTTKQNLTELKKRAKELRQAKKDLRTKKRKAKGKAAKQKVQDDIDKVTKELKKVFDDYDFEDSLTTNPRKPKKEPQARAWKLKERQNRLNKLRQKQKKWEQKLRKKKGLAVLPHELRNYPGASLAEMSVAHQDIMAILLELEGLNDELKRQNCDFINDHNIEICYTLNGQKNQLVLNLQEREMYFVEMAISFPPVFVRSGLYLAYETFTESQEAYQYLREVMREMIFCEEFCQIIERRAAKIQSSINQHIALNKSLINEIQSEIEFDFSPVEVDIDLEDIPFEIDDIRDYPIIVTPVSGPVVGSPVRIGGEPIRIQPNRLRKKKELGFCCEEVGELTCEGCISGKRTRKSCKALNKLPGYNFKAFLRAKDLTCTKL